MFSEENPHPQARQTILCKNYKDISGEAASGVAWTVHLLSQRTASTRKLVQWIRMDIAKEYS